jgi:hypothetical protein
MTRIIADPGMQKLVIKSYTGPLTDATKMMPRRPPLSDRPCSGRQPRQVRRNRHFQTPPAAPPPGDNGNTKPPVGVPAKKGFSADNQNDARKTRR